MAVYFIGLFIVFANSILTYQKRIRVHDYRTFEKFYWFTCIYLCVIAAIRYDVGQDYGAYLEIFYGSEMTVREPGYRLINTISSWLGFSGQFTIALYGIMTVVFAFLFIRNNSKFPVISVYIYFCFSAFYLQSLNIIRQALAIYIFYYSIKYIKERKFVKYILTILIGALFGHLTILVTIPLYFIISRKYTWKFKIIVVVIISLSAKLVQTLLLYTPYGFYFQFGNAGKNVSFTFILETILCLFFFLQAKKMEEENIEFYNMNFVLLCFTGMTVLNLNSALAQYLERVMYYFVPAQLILIPEYLYATKRKDIKIFAIIIIFAIFFFYTVVLRGEVNNLVPYQVFWGKNLG